MDLHTSRSSVNEEPRGSVVVERRRGQRALLNRVALNRWSFSTEGMSSSGGGYALAGSLGAIVLLLMIWGTAALIREERRLRTGRGGA